jgi:hypothetical protein
MQVTCSSPSDRDVNGARDRDKRRDPRREDERLGGVEVAGRGLRAGEPFKRRCNPLQRLGGRGIFGQRGLQSLLRDFEKRISQL